ncbi:hypothetical protein KIN20_000326 [Parelaphostrongylus tenuis]|uniref:Uncharacterized protein n=1 Tax=Parelaphostrongylus tenuis TaxID=148309 RepID=A0AAD5QFH8_PARTN|nr:hypothetical protein KIN20_000326 [Parelaphostrongylus tenuis]
MGIFHAHDLLENDNELFSLYIKSQTCVMTALFLMEFAAHRTGRHSKLILRATAEMSKSFEVEISLNNSTTHYRESTSKLAHNFSTQLHK